MGTDTQTQAWEVESDNAVRLSLACVDREVPDEPFLVERRVSGRRLGADMPIFGTHSKEYTYTLRLAPCPNRWLAVERCKVAPPRSSRHRFGTSNTSIAYSRPSASNG